MSVFKRASQRFSGAEKMLLSHNFVNCFRTKAFRQRRRLIFRCSFTGRFGGFSRSVFSCIRRVRNSEEICFHEKTLKNSLSYFLIFSKNMLYRKRLLAKFPAALLVFSQLLFQISTGNAFRGCSHCFRCAFNNNSASFRSAPRPHVNNVIAVRDEF